MTTHFSSPDRVFRRRKGALARLPKVANALPKDKPKKNPRTQEQLDFERQRLAEIVSGNYQKKLKEKKAFHLDDLK